MPKIFKKRSKLNNEQLASLFFMPKNKGES